MHKLNYGFCRQCGADVTKRERRPNGNDTCFNGHVLPSRQTVPYDKGYWTLQPDGNLKWDPNGRPENTPQIDWLEDQKVMDGFFGSLKALILDPSDFTKNKN